MAVYIPIGHGFENTSRSRDSVPEGCFVIVIEPPGGGHVWGTTSELFEYTQLTDFLKAHSDKKDIFKNPKENAKEIFDIFGSVAIFSPGEKYPNIEYNLLLSWSPTLLLSSAPVSPHKTIDVRYSGLIPFESFIDPSFTTKNIVSELKTRSNISANISNNKYPYINKMSHAYNNIWLENQKKIYKFSIFPSPNDFINVYETIDTRKKFLITNGLVDQAEILTEDTIDDFDFGKPPIEDQIDTLFMGEAGHPVKKEGFIHVSLKTLMAKYPGVYIHLVCRGRNNNINDREHTIEELFTKRIPLMSNNQKTRGIDNIEHRDKNQKSKFNIHSTKNTSNIMLAGLKKGLVHTSILKLPKIEGGSTTRRKNCRKTKRSRKNRRS